MSEDVIELRRKLDELERKTAIWRSQVLVAILVFTAGWVASAVWIAGRLSARIERSEKALGETRKTVEAESFILRDAAGKERASLAVNKNGVARLAVFRDGKSPRAYIAENGLGVVTFNDTDLPEGKFAFNVDEDGELWTEKVLSMEISSATAQFGKQLPTRGWDVIVDAPLSDWEPKRVERRRR